VGRLLARLLVAAAATGLTLLVVEGALSFAGGRSLRTLVHGDLPQFRTLEAERARRADGPRSASADTAAASTAGADRAAGAAGAGDAGTGTAGTEPPLPSQAFDLHPDPAVGRVLKRNATVELHGKTIETDDLGMRRRDGPQDPEALRIVVLGDSVAFGWGLDAGTTIGEVLERLLREHRPADGRPVEVQTCGIPGWNTHNAAAFLFDHWDRLRPDLVLYFPVANDVSDGIVTASSGFGDFLLPDLLSPDPWFHTGYNSAFLAALLERRRRGEVRTTLADAGCEALENDLGPESRRRFDATAARLRDLRQELAARHCELRLLFYAESAYGFMLQDRLRGADLPVIPLFTTLAADDMLSDTDAHPNARSAAAIAGWIAQALVAAGDVSGPLDALLPQPPSEVTSRRAEPHDAEDIRQRADAARASFRKRLRSEVDIPSGVGCLQVYGALDGAGRAGSRLLVQLACEAADEDGRRDGQGEAAAAGAPARLRLEVAPVAERPDLYPLAVAVEVDGVRIGSFTIDGGSAEPQDGRRQVIMLDVPDPHGTAIDVKLVPERYGVLPDGPRWSEVSFRLISIACEGR